METPFVNRPACRRKPPCR